MTDTQQAIELRNRIELERRIIRHVVRELRAAGFEPDTVYDGGEYVKAHTERAVLDAVFAVDDATVHFDRGAGANGRAHGVYFVLGNGIDVLSDWHCGDAAFDAVLDRCADWIGSLEG